MVINQGDIFWIELDEPSGSEPGYVHPHVIIQNNLFNRSRINTVVVCVLTSNLRRANSPGNVLLEAGEADLPEKSVVNVSQILTISQSQLGEKIGTLSAERIRQILDGIRLVLEPHEPE
ncbi:type II toxin-antitoxin system PemK/MazF family toxin [Tychonema sp. LEGE 06208]|uniref:type II toxin-antitoxin system PemK/MazF family toxin n=1 Tax=Tychonema sp. LEGE 06208 TaxID=1828663 RepID=UPI00187FA986|nr:type II toxin-antitoxin system PemK/MazF family toxin [Tychonema sp. LEGE 06208]MBE9163133.1 type II toxin-antitoxin system PemK/MazF family toxin [Tychonema sp. LEGE 06208]